MCILIDKVLAYLENGTRVQNNYVFCTVCYVYLHCAGF